MILNIHFDASYLYDTEACSRASGIYLLVWVPIKNRPIQLNRAIFTLCTYIKCVAASAAEAELGALFLNAK